MLAYKAGKFTEWPLPCALAYMLAACTTQPSHEGVNAVGEEDEASPSAPHITATLLQLARTAISTFSDSLNYMEARFRDPINARSALWRWFWKADGRYERFRDAETQLTVDGVGVAVWSGYCDPDKLSDIEARTFPICAVAASVLLMLSSIVLLLTSILISDHDDAGAAAEDQPAPPTTDSDAALIAEKQSAPAGTGPAVAGSAPLPPPPLPPQAPAASKGTEEKDSTAGTAAPSDTNSVVGNVTAPAIPKKARKKKASQSELVGTAETKEETLQQRASKMNALHRTEKKKMHEGEPEIEEVSHKSAQLSHFFCSAMSCTADFTRSRPPAFSHIAYEVQEEGSDNLVKFLTAFIKDGAAPPTVIVVLLGCADVGATFDRLSKQIEV